MTAITKVLAWLIGYYYVQCECGRWVAVLDDGRLIGWCSHPEEAK